MNVEIFQDHIPSIKNVSVRQLIYGRIDYIRMGAHAPKPEGTEVCVVVWIFGGENETSVYTIKDSYCFSCCLQVYQEQVRH